MYDPTNPVTVYCNTCWWSDKWDPMTYAKDYDPSRPFWVQLKELAQEVPWMALGVNQPTIVNSDYCNAAGGLKNCYLVFYADFVEDSYYCDTVVNLKDCFDCFLTGYSEQCYECVNVTKCYRTYFSIDCDDSYDIYFSKSLVGCSDCFGCINLRKKQYCIFNEQYSKEEYFEKIKAFDLSTQEGIRAVREKTAGLFAKHPRKYMHGHHNVNTTGDYAEHSKNSSHCFFVENVEDSKYLFIMYLRATKDCYDYCFFGDNATRVYETVKSGDDVSNLKFCNGCWPASRDITYSQYCISSNNLFGCAGLRNKSYCILNKQYTKEEYEKLVPVIIENMKKHPYRDAQGRTYAYGEFFPVEFSPFSYNEAITQEFFPLEKSVAESKGFKWLEVSEKKHNITKTADQMPQSMRDVDDSVLNEIIQCEHRGTCGHQCSAAFRIIPQELAFYRRMNFALPRLCPNCRHYERLKQSNPIELYHRKCQCATSAEYKNTTSHFHGEDACPNEFETSYAPERKEIVYCEQCYQAEVS